MRADDGSNLHTGQQLSKADELMYAIKEREKNNAVFEAVDLTHAESPLASDANHLFYLVLLPCR